MVTVLHHLSSSLSGERVCVCTVMANKDIASTICSLYVQLLYSISDGRSQIYVHL